MFALSAVGRVGAFALTALLAPISLIVGLGVTVAGFAVARMARLSAMLIGLRMLSAFGAGATLSAMGASLGAVSLLPCCSSPAIGARNVDACR